MDYYHLRKEKNGENPQTAAPALSPKSTPFLFKRRRSLSVAKVDSFFWLIALRLRNAIIFAVSRFNWQQQFRRRYPDELLDIAKNRAKGEYKMGYVPAPRITEADKKKRYEVICLHLKHNMDLCSPLLKIDVLLLENAAIIDHSLYRALDKKLYVLIFGKPFEATSDKPIWHFPEKLYNFEPTLRQCAESALKSVLGDLTHTFFVGNAPMAHMVMQPTEQKPNVPSYKRFFFKCSVVAAPKYNISNCEDFVWVTKDERLEFFPEQAEFFKKIIS